MEHDKENFDISAMGWEHVDWLGVSEGTLTISRHSAGERRMKVEVWRTGIVMGELKVGDEDRW